MKHINHSETPDRPGPESTPSQERVRPRISMTFLQGKIMKSALFLLAAAFCIGMYLLANKKTELADGANKFVPAVNNHALQVEVLDGAGSMKVAQQATNFLRARGYDVVEMKKNNGGLEDRSIILDRSGHSDEARKLATVLGIPQDKVFQKPDRTLYLDMTIVVGKDYSRLNPFQSSTERTNH